MTTDRNWTPRSRVGRREFLKLAGYGAGAAVLAACAPAATPTAAPTAAATTAGGPTSAPAAKKFTIGISNSFISSEYRTQMIQELKDVNAEYMQAGITNDLVIESADTDVPGQIQQLQNLINKKVDAILVNPGDVNGLNATLEDAVSKGIIVISVDQARRQAAEEKHSLATEVKYLLLHGVLHALGHDHETDEGEMNELEVEVRRSVGLA